MGNFKDLTGKKIGRWTILYKDDEKSKKTGRTHWICKCECGTIRTVIAKDLLNGKSISCGCLRRERTSEAIFVDLTGKKFGRWTVLELNKEKSTPAEKYWICRCECGNIDSISGRNLKSGTSKSCGCLRRELQIKRNKYEICGDYGKCYFNNSFEYFLFDTRDLDLVKSYTWRKSNGYARGRSSDENGNELDVMFHRLVIERYYSDLDYDYQVDHIDHNTLDNRFSNIRPCTRNQNQLNRGFEKSSNTGERNISYICSDNTYHVNIEGINKSFKTFEDAKAFKDKYIRENPNNFRYDESKIKSNDDYTRPFVDENGNPLIFPIIEPFIVVNDEKFNKGLGI